MSQNIDIERIKDQANSPDTFFYLLPGYKWKRSGNQYRAGSKSGISIYQKNGTWIVNAFNGDFEKHDLFGVVAELNNLDLSSYDDLLTAAGIICHAANLRLEDFLTEPLTDTPLAYQKPVQRKITHTPPPFIPNREREIKKSYSDFERAAPGSAPHNAAARYYQDKTGIEPDALNKYGVFPLQSLTDNYRNKRTFSGENFAFLYIPDTAGNIKIKNPTDKDRKVGYYQSTGNYVFGLHTLPDQDARKNYTLIIAAGEDDTNTINYHFQKYGFCAICFNSETVNIRPEYLQQLRRDFKDVFCLFDNDATGRKMATRNATENGIPFIDISNFTGLKDVCDIYRAGRIRDLLQAIQLQTATKSTYTGIDARIDYTLPDVTVLRPSPGSKYIISKDPVQAATDLRAFWRILKLYAKVLLTAATGSGKTQIIISLLKAELDTPGIFRSLGIEKIILAVPYNSFDQVKEKVKQYAGYDAYFVNGKSTYQDIENAAGSRFIIVTYNSLPKVGHLLKDSLFVVDEIHLTGNEAGFRFGSVEPIFKAIQDAKKVLVMSGTPPLELAVGSQLTVIDSKLTALFNFHMVRFESVPDQVKNVQLRTYKGARINAIMAHIEMCQRIPKDGAHVIFLDNTKVLETAATLLNDQVKDIATVISSDQDNSTGNPAYNAIIKGDPLPPELQYIFCTKFLATGIDFNFPVASVAVFGENDAAALVQKISRPRHKGDINKDLDIFIYKAAPTDQDTAAIIQQFQDKQLIKDQAKKETRINRFNDILKYAIETAHRFNDQKIQFTNDLPTALTGTTDIYFCEFSRSWKPAISRILKRIQEDTAAKLTPFGLLAMAKQLDNTIRILPPEHIETPRNVQAIEILKERKKTHQEDQEHAAALFTENLKQCLEIVFHTTKDYELKQKIKTEVTPPRAITEPAAALRNEYPRITAPEYMTAPAMKYFDLKHIAATTKAISSTDILTIIQGTPKAKDYNAARNRIITAWQLKADPAQLDSNDLAAATINRAVIEAIRAIKKSKRRDSFTLPELIKIVKQAAPRRHITPQRAIEVIESIFEIDRIPRCKATGQTATLYKIGTRVTIEKVLEKCGKNPGKSAASENAQVTQSQTVTDVFQNIKVDI
jgi:hypothetical protein